jgi:hypothetical protein
MEVQLKRSSRQRVQHDNHATVYHLSHLRLHNYLKSFPAGSSDLVGSSEDLNPLFDRSKLLITSRSSRFTKRHDSTRLPILGQAQQLQKPSVDILVHSSEMLERSSETLFRESGPDDVLKDTGRVLGPLEELLDISKTVLAFEEILTLE